MICAWDSLLSVVPVWMRNTVDKLGREDLQELRLRLDKPPILIMGQKAVTLDKKVSNADINFIINMVTRYSPWSVSTGVNGYYTAPGGHRIGICGTFLQQNGHPSTIRDPTSLCIRISRDFPGISRTLNITNESVLIIGAPGCGKTTLLRDIIRQQAKDSCVAVIDEKQEIFPQYNGHFCYEIGVHTDVIYGCSKEYGIDVALRNLGPTTIAVDEITAEKDCDALLRAGWCGVYLFATAHAGSIHDLSTRTVYRPLLESHLFQCVIVMNRDKTWQVERMETGS